MQNITENRREFLRKAMIATASVSFLTNCDYPATAQKSDTSILDAIRRNTRPIGAEGMGALDFPLDVSPKTELSAETDKGDAIKIGGIVYKPDGKTPAANTLIYLYHTDFEGYYGRRDGEHKHGRYRGWMLTGSDGRYAFNTIKPAPYPEMRWAAHIHMTLTTETAREDWIDSILFEGDRLISTREREESGRRGGFNPIVTLAKGDGGLLYGRRDIQLMKA